ncbi:MAG: UDP-glucose/GDP-mannose dehydrogenase family protein [Armatimonadota bacterium]|nr:MAG: UDP-glucose/GDP-mannose dehydrogenase family protein [Armatimonadota bacterium]
MPTAIRRLATDHYSHGGPALDICVIGMGYVGLVTAAVFADMGNDVVGVEVDAEKVARLAAGECPIYEPGLQELLSRTLQEGRLSFTADTAAAVAASEVIFIAVNTPMGDNGLPDLSQVEAAACAIAPAASGRKIVVNKSTVPVGTGDVVARIVADNAPPGAEVDVCSNPEFLREGSAIEDAFNPDRIVIGASNGDAASKLVELYAPLNRPVIVTDVASAEMIKYASNSFLATKVSFINVIADICEEVGADVSAVAHGMGADRRIGHEYLQPGLGYGGSCLSRDAEALISTAAAAGCDFALLRAAQDVNHARVGRLVARMAEAMGGLDGRTVGVLGLAFKPDTDDLREAKAVELIRVLLERGAKVRAYDPVAMEKCAALLPDVAYAESADDAARGCDALVVATEWHEFKSMDLARIKALMSAPVIFDGRNAFSPERVRALGFRYYGIGRP